MARHLTAVLVILAWFVCPVSTSVVIPIGFRDLVSRATVAFSGEVVGLTSRWAMTVQGRVIVTDVTFRIERLLKGEAAHVITLEFLGGRVGSDELTVMGMPHFAPGDRVVALADQSKNFVSPIVGFNQGWFPVRAAPGTDVEYVTTFDGHVLGGIEALGRPRPEVSAQPLVPLRRDALEAEIIREVRLGRR